MSFLTRDKKGEDIETQRRKGPVKMDPDIRGQPQATECQGLSATRSEERGMEWTLPMEWSFQKKLTLPTP